MSKFTIKIKKYSNVIEEFEAGGTIYPGMLVAVNSSGKVVAHSQADKDAIPMFALEDELQGKGINEPYVSGDRVQVWIPYRGDMVYGILADGENAVIGSFLTSKGNGMLQVHVTDFESWHASQAGDVSIYPLQIVGQAVEAVDLSDSSGAEESGPLGYHKRIIIRIV